MGPLVMTKRSDREDALVDGPTASIKRRKIEDAEGRREVGATELASAFALASLATLSPQWAPTKSSFEQTDSGNGEVARTMSSEGRSPKNEPVPVSPELRSPVGHGLKRVTFAPGIKERSRLTSRKLSFPPRIHQGSRMPPGFARAQGHTRNMQHPNWSLPPRQVGYNPPMMMPPHPPNQWICDFCNMASFPTYQEACIHEGACRARMAMMQAQAQRNQQLFRHGVHAQGPTVPQARPMFPIPPGDGRSSSEAVLSSNAKNWSQGVVSLSIPKTDQEWLSPLNCFIRAECIEVFSAYGEEVTKLSKRGRVSLHQVGIRCRFCKHRSKEERQMAAVSYPQSVAGIYESVKRWQKSHVECCEDMPKAVSEQLEELSSSNAWVPTTRQYWADSARALGMVDTDEGIRFASDPKTPECLEKHRGMQAIPVSIEAASAQGRSISDGQPIVTPMDLNMIPPYVYFLTSQVETCHFTEADRFVARSRCPVGYPGFQCRHCSGHAGLGKYFPVSSKSLATNSTSQNIHAHLLKCRKCPPAVKDQLVALKEEKNKAPRLEPGWRKVFFDKIWSRLHG